jgi:hypothetical protein
MPTKFDAVLASPPTGRAVPLILDHTAYGSARILHGAPVPWSEPAECQSYFGRAQGLLRPDLTLIDVEAVYAQHLAHRTDLTDAMGARSRTGFALKTLLADQALTASVVRLVEVLGSSSRLPLALQVPGPLRWLALAQTLAGNPEVSRIEADHGESASMYVADWLRGFETCPVTLLILDGRRADHVGLDGLVDDDLAAYSPVINAVDHYRWGLALRTDVTLELHGNETGGAVLPPSFWIDGSTPGAKVLLAEIPGDAEPELVLARLATLG